MYYNKERKELFQKIPNHFSINEKVSIWVQRHENNYFINRLDINIDTEIENDQYIKPVTFVNNKNLKSWLKRDTKCKNHKLHWAMTKYFEYLNEFKHKVYSNDFKTLEDAKIEACVLYKQYNDQYKPSKSTIRKQEDGTIHIAKKIKLSKDINEKNEETDQIVQFKQSLVKHLSENYQNIHNILDTTTVFGTKSIKKKLEENTNENMFLKSLSTYKPSNNPKHDLANYIFVTFYKLIDDFKP